MNMRAMASAAVLATGIALPMSPATAQTVLPACAELGAAGTVLGALVGVADGIDAAAVDGFCRQFGDLERRADAAEAQAAELRTAMQVTLDQLPPRGSIALVDDSGGCPAGWVDLGLIEPEVFAGRVPVAVGLVGEATFRGYREIGGSEEVLLEEVHLPPHTHALPLAFARSRGNQGTGGSSGSLGGGFSAGGTFGDQVPVRALAGRERTERAGAGMPHENMPPFVGLFWCRRG